MKEKGQASHAERATEERSAPGAKPGGMVGREVTVMASTFYRHAVDHKKKTVTLKRAQGQYFADLKVEDPEACLQASSQGRTGRSGICGGVRDIRRTCREEMIQPGAFT